MQIPDVSGYRLKDAERLLKANGAGKVIIKLTSPPRMRSFGYDGNSRVVRQCSMADGALELLVCNTDHDKQGC